MATDLLTLGYAANRAKTERFGPSGSKGFERRNAVLKDDADRRLDGNVAGSLLAEVFGSK